MGLFDFVSNAFGNSVDAITTFAGTAANSVIQGTSLWDAAGKGTEAVKSKTYYSTPEETTAAQQAVTKVTQSVTASPVSTGNAVFADKNGISSSNTLSKNTSKTSIVTKPSSDEKTTASNTSNWKQTRYDVDKTGTKITQTWVNKNTGQQVAFAGITAAELAEYNAKKGNTDLANMYSEIAYPQKSTISKQTPTKSVVTKDTTDNSLVFASKNAVETTKASNLYDKIYDFKTDSEVTALAKVMSGEPVSAAEAATAAGAAVADIALPLDAVNVVNKLATGRGGELTGEDIAYGALDAVGAVLGLFTFGGGYLATRAVKAGIKGAAVAGKAAAVGGRSGQAVVLAGQGKMMYDAWNEK